jgi:hypothetical protein
MLEKFKDANSKVFWIRTSQNQPYFFYPTNSERYMWVVSVLLFYKYQYDHQKEQFLSVNGVVRESESTKAF